MTLQVWRSRETSILSGFLAAKPYKAGSSHPRLLLVWIRRPPEKVDVIEWPHPESQLQTKAKVRRLESDCLVPSGPGRWCQGNDTAVLDSSGMLHLLRGGVAYVSPSSHNCWPLEDALEEDAVRF